MTATAPSPDPPINELHQDLAAHALHLRRLSQRLDHLTSDHTELRERSDQISEIAADLQTALNNPQTSPGPPCWPTMTADRAAQAWETLAAWIENVLVAWYDITREQLPDCWPLHRPAVVELSWLQHAHHAAYQPGAAPHLAAEWHTHWQPTALRHVHNAIPRRGRRICSPGHHLAGDTQ